MSSPATPTDTILLLALPASGKSEVRRYLASLTPEQCEREMHLGSTLQLDDYPYVHLMHEIDEAIYELGAERIFYHGPTRPFRDAFEWGTLVALLNEDYDRLLAQRPYGAEHAAELLFERLDAARVKVGLEPSLSKLPHRVWKAAARRIEKEARRELDLLDSTLCQDRTGKTIVIELARGGPHGASFPLTPPRGYEYALNTFSDMVLSRASILYVQVDPAESRRKNRERGRPDGQGSILFHAVPLEVMLGEYGTDDLLWLASQSDVPGTIRVDKLLAEGDRYRQVTRHLKVAVVDNRADLTSFVREDPATWSNEDIAKLHGALAAGLGHLAS